MKGQKSEIRNQKSNPPSAHLLKGGKGGLLNEKGIALVMVLVLSAIVLVMMAGLIYMVASGTQVSGIQKRYKTAVEAGVGGANITFQVIKLKEDAPGTTSLLNALTAGGLTAIITTPAGCTSTDRYGYSFAGLNAKLNAPTSAWSANCDSSLTIAPPASGDNSTYDMRFDLGTYRVYSKIVDTVYGNTGGDTGIVRNQVTGPNDEQGVTVPFLYTIELDSENPANPAERAKLSILYKE
jgi:hypothetical protein